MAACCALVLRCSARPSWIAGPDSAVSGLLSRLGLLHDGAAADDAAGSNPERDPQATTQPRRKCKHGGH
jgi:hypothetical protein